MSSVSVLPVAGEVFEDARDDGRFLRVSWHPADGMCVLSIWRDAQCVASFQLARAAAADLINELVQGLVQPPTEPSTVARYSAHGSRWKRLTRKWRRTLRARLTWS
jgi:hypothetical protein